MLLTWSLGDIIDVTKTVINQIFIVLFVYFFFSVSSKKKKLKVVRAHSEISAAEGNTILVFAPFFCLYTKNCVLTLVYINVWELKNIHSVAVVVPGTPVDLMPINI